MQGGVEGWGWGVVFKGRKDVESDGGGYFKRGQF